MPISIIPLFVATAAVFIFGRRKGGKKPTSGITVFEGQRDGPPEVLHLENGERFALRFWATNSQEWTFDGADPQNSIKILEIKFDKSPIGGLLPNIFTFEAKFAGTVAMKFSLIDRDQGTKITSTIHAEVK